MGGIISGSIPRYSRAPQPVLYTAVAMVLAAAVLIWLNTRPAWKGVTERGVCNYSYGWPFEMVWVKYPYDAREIEYVHASSSTPFEQNNPQVRRYVERNGALGSFPYFFWIYVATNTLIALAILAGTFYLWKYSLMPAKMKTSPPESSRNL